MLAQLLVISPLQVIPHNTEPFLAYYDIFVRNAFGNYRDILREVAYSPMMGRMLTYYGSKSTEYTWQTEGSIQYADENFAREIMQLFSIGLVKLNIDGTPIKDGAGNPINTYTNDDITEYARAWTGFVQQGPRGNFEEREQGNNSIDPMKINIKWRDHQPKMGLDGKYIGDGYPLCSDLSKNVFLQKGAKWRLLGKSKSSNDQNFLRLDEEADNIVVSVLDPSSVLLGKLCEARNGQCTFPGVVVIDSTLSCTGIECSIDKMSVIQIQSGGSTIHYEFVQPPCVHFPFFSEGKRISKSRSGSSNGICVDVNSAIAAEACCGDDLFAVHSTCAYTGERVSFPIASSRCSRLGKGLCDFKSVSSTDCGICCNYDGYFWTNAKCEVYAIVDRNGRVAVARPDDSLSSNSYFSLTFFRVHWEGGTFPNPNDSCAGGSCERVGNYCRCSVEIQEDQVFTSAPSKDAIISKLRMGGLSPPMTNYMRSQVFDGVTAHFTDDTDQIGIEAVFEVIDDFGRTLNLKNLESMVKIGPQFKFRNPPTFYNENPEVRDAQYETEAAIDHYLYHASSAPFLSLRFIQRFGISNPSPGFVERVAQAFKTGKCDALSISGNYGDLGALIGAIITDEEAREVLLDSDPSSGSLREPLLKLVALMRNLDHKQLNEDHLTAIDGNNLVGKIGQESYEMPNVFSFFLPEYAPPGEIISSSLFVSIQE